MKGCKDCEGIDKVSTCKLCVRSLVKLTSGAKDYCIPKGKCIRGLKGEIISKDGFNECIVKTEEVIFFFFKKIYIKSLIILNFLVWKEKGSS